MAHQTDAQSPALKKTESKPKKEKGSTEKKGSADTQQESNSTEKDNKSDKKDKKKRKKSASEDAAPETDGEMKKKKKRRHTEDDNEQKDKDDESHKKKKKRVSFGPGTKEKDGSSDSDSDDSDDNDAVATDGADADTEDTVDNALEEMKQRKRDKKKQRKNGTTSTEAPVHETPILSYLSHYHRARATWKFQKNRETNLFKHLYSLEHVPTQYNTSLLAYMQGLKGDAAKQRMSDTARDVINADADLDKPKDDEATESQEAKNPEYLEAVNAFRECLAKGGDDIDTVNFGEKLEGDVQKRLPKRQRAELVFFAVAGKLFGPEDAKPKPKPKAPQPAVPKKRKNRTMVVDISSSEDSDDDDDDNAPASKKAVSKPAPATSDDETSSSGSSDSDSDSDSDDTAAPAKKTAASTPSSSGPNGATMSNKERKTAQKKQKFVPVREAKPTPAVPKKPQKRKLRTAQIEISSSESDSD
ncbi:hypothetical protein N7475_000558 [Penicillium sp. IBT 31633x]|nr:hypothetical protein N7475_000558 [Penicillium sp. IBT 31633x]